MHELADPIPTWADPCVALKHMDDLRRCEFCDLRWRGGFTFRCQLEDSEGVGRRPQDVRDLGGVREGMEVGGSSGVPGGHRGMEGDGAARVLARAVGSAGPSRAGPGIAGPPR